MKISLLDEFQYGIEPLEFDSKEDASFIFEAWIESKNFNKTVLVAFINWEDIIEDNYRDEQRSFLVTHSRGDLAFFLDNILNYDNWEYIHLIVLEFPNYQKAFDYCKDLKESF